MKRLLLITNLYSGTRQGAKYLGDIVEIFCRADYEVVVAATTGPGAGTKIARERAKDADVVVASGGDGTFNEVVAGVMESGVKVPIGYLPAGPTNDFASSLKLSTDLLQAAYDVVEGKPETIDIGSFNGRYFSYVASFGAFTNTSSDVPQGLKNSLGHLAYILGGIRDVLTIRSVEMKFMNEDGHIYAGKYLFGAICNSTSMGGVLTLRADLVNMNDGVFEVLLIKSPSNIIELQQILMALTSQNYDNCPLIDFFSTSHLEITADPDMPWTLDGEYQAGARDIDIVNHFSAVSILVNDHEKPGAPVHRLMDPFNQVV